MANHVYAVPRVFILAALCTPHDISAQNAVSRVTTRGLSKVLKVITPAANPYLPLTRRSRRVCTGERASARIAAQSRAEEKGAKRRAIWYRRNMKIANKTAAKMWERVRNDAG